MRKGNVLVIGNSGVGKSTLINAVLGDERAETGWGTKGTTSELAIYSNDKLPFQLIDTVGFEPSIVKSLRAVNAVKRWSKECAKEGHEDNNVNVIWFCVEGTSSKLFPEALKSLSRATAMWETVPVIVVITKSYSVPDREQNIAMVYNAFARQTRHSKNLRKVIPVVASTFVLNDTAFAPPEGIIELIDATNELMPEGIRAGEADIAAFKLNRKRALAHGITAVSTAAAVTDGAVPIPFADSAILAPIEIAMVNSLARIYGIGKNQEAKQFLSSIVDVGTVSIAGKSAVSALKAIPGLNIGASVVNAIVAGSIVATLGEGSIYAFEQVYLGKKSVSDVSWLRQVLESKLSSQFIEIVRAAAGNVKDTTALSDIAGIILDAIRKSVSSSDTRKPE